MRGMPVRRGGKIGLDIHECRPSGRGWHALICRYYNHINVVRNTIRWFWMVLNVLPRRALRCCGCAVRRQIVKKTDDSGASGLPGFRSQVAVTAFTTGLATLWISDVTPHADLSREYPIFCFIETGHAISPFSVLLIVSSSDRRLAGSHIVQASGPRSAPCVSSWTVWPTLRIGLSGRPRTSSLRSAAPARRRLWGVGGLAGGRHQRRVAG